MTVRILPIVGLCLGLGALVQPGPAMAAAAAIRSQPHVLSGRWEGAIDVGGRSIRVVFRIDETGQAVMDSPDQGATGLPVQSVTLEGLQAVFLMPAVEGRFEGVLSADGATLQGDLMQGAARMPLTLTRTAAVADTAGPARPQTPQPPFPYSSRDVTFDNPAAPGVTLAGTLTLPDGEGPHPAVILITGSGPQDRDETIVGHQPFLVWADALSRQGVAVLRYDDRGVGASTGSFQAATGADLASDARAALDWLAVQPGIDSARIGLVGHSEGGTLAPYVVQQGGRAAWVVMLAGPTVPGGEVIAEQQRRIATAMGVPAPMVEQGNILQRQVMQAVADNADDHEASVAAVRALLVAAGQPEADAWQSAQQVSTDWYRWFVVHDPEASMRAIEVPVLAVFGGLDLQVPADQNADALRAIRPDIEIVVLPGLNHLLQTAQTGAPTEYQTIEETVAPVALKTVVAWVRARAGLE